MKDISIPRHIDSQPQFFWWELDELIVAVALFGAGIVTETLIWMVLCIIGTNMAFRKYKDGSLDGVLPHIFYWAGLMGLNRIFNDGLKREFWL